MRIASQSSRRPWAQTLLVDPGPLAQEKAFNAAFVDGVMSPAELEMLAADADTVDDLVEALRTQF